MHSVHPHQVLSSGNDLCILTEQVHQSIVYGHSGNLGGLGGKVLGKVLEGGQRGRGAGDELDGLVAQLS